VHVQTEPETGEMFEDEEEEAAVEEPQPETSSSSSSPPPPPQRESEATPDPEHSADAVVATAKRGIQRGASKGGAAPGHLRRRRKNQLGGFAPLLASDRVVGLCTLNQVDPYPITYSLSNP
jgi:hypothetical protein